MSDLCDENEYSTGYDPVAYVPTTTSVRAAYATDYYVTEVSGRDAVENRAEAFDRWLAAHDRDIQAQALRDFSRRLDRSFDHAYDFDVHAWEDQHAEGYRHRDDQVNAVLASAMQDAARLTEGGQA